MDALFVIVAQLLIVPLILWALIVIDLTVGVASSIVSVLLGRKSATDAIDHRWRGVRRRLVWSLIFLTSGLLLADLVFFDAIVHQVLRSVDDREDLDVQFAHAEGSFILGRIEIDHLQIGGRRGQASDPSGEYSLEVEALVIDIDTLGLLTFDFALEDLSLEGVRGTYDRYHPPRGKREREPLAREFTVERMHFGSTHLDLRDHTKLDAAGEPRNIVIELVELDSGPLSSESAIFDLLYRTRGRGTIAGHDFVLSALEIDGEHETQLEVRDLSLDALADTLEERVGVRARGTADIELRNHHHPGPPASVDITAAITMHQLELAAGKDATMRTKLLLDMAADMLSQLGEDFPLEFTVTIDEGELAGAQSLADSGVIERIADAIADALKNTLDAKNRRTEG